MAHVDNLRGHFPVVRTGAYLNTGTYGPIPDVSVEAMKQVLAEQLSEGRHRREHESVRNLKRMIREQLGHLFRTDATNFALTDSATQASNIVLNGLPLFAGDEIITTDLEHPAALLPIFLQKQRRGVVVKVLNGQLPDDELCAQLESSMSARTRLVVSSHVSFTTGRRLPVERFTHIAHRRGAYSLVDGAQGAGAEFINLEETSIDFYAFSGQKWLSGPDGTGALYVRKGLGSVLDVSAIGVTNLMGPDAYHATGSFLLADDAARYEYSSVNADHWAGWLESLRFLRVQAGWDYVFERIHGLSGHLMDRLLDMERVQLVTPREHRVGIVHFRVPGVRPEEFERSAMDRMIMVRGFETQNTIRVSTGWFNTEDDVERLLNLVRQYAESRV